ncbi:uncharacterized protein LOC115631891 [Scaptodrosophila lebanonensis]|uniref:Uncharacterized protein LOC115631891 n=1 Tax=Drosophila lebanonensis TaxID=7225 RepID=A0A6J2U9C4_DROLE|nr:uncharacterized protein LOC115631891 [Scaptodrosophila lebanonensis]
MELSNNEMERGKGKNESVGENGSQNEMPASIEKKAEARAEVQCKRITKADLDIETDMAFVDNALKMLNMKAGPEVRNMLLNLAYTLTRDKILEAKSFAALANRSVIDVKDLEIANIAKTKDYTHGPYTKPALVKPAELPKPLGSNSMWLPPLRHCQVGDELELEGMEKKRPAENRLPKKKPHNIFMQ